MLKRCLAFYRTILERRDGDAALKAINDAVSTTEETFWNVSAELAFKLAFQGYMRGEGSPEGATVRADAFARRRAARAATARRRRACRGDRGMARTDTRFPAQSRSPLRSGVAEVLLH